MSTKIYNAYCYEGNIDSLFKWLVNFRKRYWTVCRTFLPTDKSKYAMYEEIREVMKKGQCDLFNFQASAVVYPYSSYPISGMLYVQFFGVEYPFRLAKKKFRLPKQFKDFHYQNQADYPKHISEKEWKQREKIWDKIFSDSPVPAAAGLVFPILEECNLFDFVYKTVGLK